MDAHGMVRYSQPCSERRPVPLPLGANVWQQQSLADTLHLELQEMQKTESK